MNLLKYIIVLVLCTLLSLVMWILSKNFLTGLLSGSVLFFSYLILNLFKSTTPTQPPTAPPVMT